ncbi:MAG: serine hydrolase [Cytophagales bacterium]|nr:serine hydrolase [Cytophagales bacterium]
MPSKTLFFNFFLACLLSMPLLLSGQESPQKHWVDSVYHQMNLDQKIGQLFMVAAYSNRNEQHAKDIEQLIEKQHIGGVIFFQGGPVRQAQQTNRYQSVSRIPLFVAMDAEWGLGMRLDSIADFPYQMTMGAIQNQRLVYDMGKEIARQMKELGVHINFAPVVDINSNPANPVIGRRAFGEDTTLVSKLGIAYMKGLQENGIIACMKHFPGHGDTGKDSHYDLPVVKHKAERLRRIELAPFRKMIDAGVMSAMVAHLQVTALDSTPKHPASLSPKIINELLKDSLKFHGLVFTDALNMKGVTKGRNPGEIELEALKAGNDMLLFPVDPALAIKKIKKAVESGELPFSLIEERVKKILYAKYWANLHKTSPIKISGLLERLQTPVEQTIRRRLYEEAATVVKNKHNGIPIRQLDTLSLACVSFTKKKSNTHFQNALSRYAPFKHFQAGLGTFSYAESDKLFTQLKPYNAVIIGIHQLLSRKNGYGLSKSVRLLIKRLQLEGKQVTVSLFGKAYALQAIERADQILCLYENTELAQNAAAEVIFGALPAKGRLPVSAGSFGFGSGLGTAGLRRLAGGTPEQVGLDSKKLGQIDSLVRLALDSGATPGCQVLVAKNGRVVYEKAFGYFTPQKKRQIVPKSIYDVASVTKVAATLQAAMFLEGRGLININDKASKYLPEIDATNKKDITLAEMLTHQGGLIPFIPFWKETVSDKNTESRWYRNRESSSYSVPVAPKLFAHHSLPDSIWKWTLAADLREPQKSKSPYRFDYKYSDHGFYILRRIVEKLTNQPMQDFLEQNVYHPLGLQSTGFLAWKKFPFKRIVPSEKDGYFRRQEIKGYVNDPVAAMAGGVEGHAGLFSNAYELAVILQMCLQDGSYGGNRIFPKGTIDRFAFAPFKESNNNRRGIGWDKPLHNGDGPSSVWASDRSFGHLGFTGISAWADPEENLIYVFISNRTYPDSENKKLIELNIRTRIHDLVYEALVKPRQNYTPLRKHLVN